VSLSLAYCETRDHTEVKLHVITSDITQHFTIQALRPPLLTYTKQFIFNSI